MGFQLRGWVSTVVETGWSGTDEQRQAFVEGFQANRLLSHNAKVLSVSGGQVPLDAMVEGQTEHTLYVRIECPVPLAPFVLQALAEHGRTSFPGP